jgi:hypothetical protein
MGEIHADTMGHLAQQLGLTASVLPAVTHKTKSLYRYQAAVRSYLSVTHYDDIAEGLVTKTILATAETMSDPADLINQAVKTLQAASIDLPAFSTLDRLVNRLRMEVHTRIYNRVLARVTLEHLVILDALATPTTIRLWIERLDWLAGLIDPDPLLEGVAHTKLRQFAAEAAALEVSELLDISQPGKRHTLLLALLRQARMRCRDELVEMMLRRVRRTQAAAKEQLEALHDQQRETEEALIGIFGQVCCKRHKPERPTTPSGVR